MEARCAYRRSSSSAFTGVHEPVRRPDGLLVLSTTTVRDMTSPRNSATGALALQYRYLKPGVPQSLVNGQPPRWIDDQQLLDEVFGFREETHRVSGALALLRRDVSGPAWVPSSEMCLHLDGTMVNSPRMICSVMVRFPKFSWNGG